MTLYAQTTKRIIAIDDALDRLEYYNILLTDQGYNVVATFAAPPADPHVIGDMYPDLIILNWVIGRQAVEMRGLEILKAYPQTKYIPLIVSAVAQTLDGEVEEIVRQHGVHILHKPVAADDLLSMIEQVLASSKEAGLTASPVRQAGRFIPR